nr:helix-turn-helix transcriptional regulator [Parabacteroides goldsteinii]
MSPINYFIRLKIQKACQYIELTSLKVNEIAMKLGFEEAAYFSRIFTRVMGVSPSVYRKKESIKRDRPEI